MAFVDKIVDFRERLAGKALELFNAGESPSEKLGVVTEWYFAAILGIPRRVNIQELRGFAKSNYVRACIDTIVKEIDQTEWSIVPKDSDDQTDYSSQISFAEDFLNNPNRNKDTFSEIVKPVIKDILEIDAAVWVKVYDGSGKLVELWSRDGGSFLKKIDYRGVEEAYYQYSWRNPLTKPIRFEPEEVVYFVNNPSSYKIYGFSPLQSVQQVVEILIQATRYNKEFFSRNAIPDAMVGVLNANRDTLKKIEASWLQKMKGQSHKLAFINSDLKFQSLAPNNRDMEWLEGQKWYLNLVCSAFGVSPSEIGFTDTTGSKSVQAGQERVTVKNAIKPYMTLIEKHINLEILPELLGVSPEDCPVIFKYFPTDHVGELEKQKKMLEEYKNQLITKNEYRQEMGYDVVTEGDEFKSTPQPMGMFGVPREGSGETEENLEERRKHAIIKSFVSNTDEIVEEAFDYKTFLSNKMKVWEKKVLKAIDVEEVEKKVLVYVKKTFGGFLQRLFNAVNTTNFVSQVKHFIKVPMKAGLEQAESELRLDIGITENFDDTAKFFADQQLNGYSLPDGKKWHGIKGATRELQTKIYREVREGIIKKEDRGQIKERVKDVFSKAEEGQAMRIARTETNRFVNQGKIQGYIDSGVKGRKRWVAHIDDTTSPQCRALDDKAVGLTEFFSWKNKQFFAPPAHPNCRSTVQFVPGDE